MDVDQNLVAGRLRLFDLADAEVVRSGERAAQHGSHCAAPARRRPNKRGSSMGTRWRYRW